MVEIIKKMLRPCFSTVEYGGVGSNVTYAFFAQGIALLSAFIMTLIVPKMIGVTEYAHWQLFLFYANYVAVTMFGVGDGLYLRLGGMRYKDLDFSRIKTEYFCVVLSQLVLAAVIWIASLFFSIESDLRFVLLLLLIYLLVQNAYGFIAPVFQAVNLTRIYSMGAVVSKASFVVILIALLLVGDKSYEPIAIAYVVGSAMSLGYCLICGRSILHADLSSLSREIQQIVNDMRTGLRIMIAYYASSLVVGVARQVIVMHWGLVTFGQMSFAFSLISFVLVFIAQFSMVLFPVLRRLDENQLKKRYGQLRDLIYVASPLAYVLYLPASIILSAWLPDYQDSLTYLGILMPMFVFDCETSLLYSTYLKVYEDTRQLLGFNVAALIFSLVASCVGAYAFDSVEFVVYGLVGAIVLRSVLCGRFLALRRLHCGWIRQTAAECCYGLIFMVSIAIGNTVFAALVSLVGYIVLIVVNPQSISSVSSLIKEKARN